MPTLIARYIFVAFFCLFAFCGLFAGSSATALITHTLKPTISNGLAWSAAIGCPLLAGAATPLPKLLERLLRTNGRFGGYSVQFWQVMMNVVFLFGLVMGIFLPNGPFNGR